MEIRLTALARAIADCWEVAEKKTASEVAQKHYDPQEEGITFLFAGELRAAVAEASSRGEFDRAFLSDLHSNFPKLGGDLSFHGTGLVARVNFHNRQHEGRRSGSDLGIVVSQPSVSGYPGAAEIAIVRDRRRALMAQAKLNQRPRGRSGRVRWGPLRNNQVKILEDHLDHSALLIYRLGGRLRTELGPFKWQLLRGRTMDEIKSWLRTGAFPAEETSGGVIEGLSFGSLGTEDAALIDALVDPASSAATAVEIRVFWPEGTGPTGRVRLRRDVEQLAQVQLLR